ncbi:lysylphosphatidylglycerol synthase domain-containing protein [Streptomyces sp. MST-110588]|uniref:lysylphosphatidylglycerol synthase domain-containing protein n=1 Tax=Streptomyces sp. MST-110588 TaxID=2833628 RepID=UPI001F5C4E42|nr:lysylphosphatidylglycerol synthase domain-containing protein [Streptomyces sp. MST-110588]UNO42471.1 flippase-like domain-containing protein [Streptomyces sp. MST-110588]
MGVFRVIEVMGERSPNVRAPADAGTGGTGDGDVPGVEVRRGEALLPARVRRPEALVRFGVGLVLVGLTLLLAGVARDTAVGLDTDAAHGARRAPHFLVGVAGFVFAVASLLVPLVFAAQRLLQRDRRRVADGLLAATVAYGATLAVGLWAVDFSPHVAVPVTAPLHPFPGWTEPLPGSLAAVLAFMTAAGMSGRPRQRAALAFTLAGGGLSLLMSGYASVLALILVLLIGTTAAHGTTYVLGSPNAPLTGQRLLRGLREAGFAPAALFRTPGPAAHGPRHYRVRQGGDRPDLDVVVLDRETQAAGLRHRMWLGLRLRTAPRRRSVLTLRGALEQEALLSYAAETAGVRTRRLLATAQLTPDAALLVYEPLAGRTLDELSEPELTDELLADVWQQFQLLRTRRIAHRSLTPSNILVGEHGAVHLVNPASGDIAAGDLVLRMDLAQLLTTLALRVGPGRAVASACAVLGADAVGSAVPLLQPIGLSRSTRVQLRLHRRTAKARAEEAARAEHQKAEHEKAEHQKAEHQKAGAAEQNPAEHGLTEHEAAEQDLLARMREEILRACPQAPLRPVRLERVRPRTVITVVASAVAGYLLLLQLFRKDANPLAAIAQADARWLLLAAAVSASSYLAATMGFVGFVPERLSFRRAALVQLASSFVNLVSPSGVGGVAINTRYLQRVGVPTRQAIASVGVGQAIGAVLHVLLVAVFGYLLSTEHTVPLSTSPALIVGLLTAAVAALTAAAIPPLRRWLAARLQSLTTGVMPRLLDLLEHPGKLAAGIAGQLLISLTAGGCLYACALAFGQRPSFSAVILAHLIGSALGSAVPTPGAWGRWRGRSPSPWSRRPASRAPPRCRSSCCSGC